MKAIPKSGFIIQRLIQFSVLAYSYSSNNSVAINSSSQWLKKLPYPVSILTETPACATQLFNTSSKTHPDINLKIDEVIVKYGYPVETHKVTTKDGYILTVFRIPYSLKSPIVKGTRKKPMYLNHGMTSNGHQWILQYRDRNLAFLLADAGFDVFLSNCRGTRYSNQHTYLTPSSMKYWDFSWDDMGHYDVPAVMKMIRNVTQTEKMYYTGHSMGTTQFFVAMSQIPELNDHIHTAFLLAPIAFIAHSRSYIRYLAPLVSNSQYLLNFILGGKLDTVPSLKAYTGLSIGQLCPAGGLSCLACNNLYFLLGGYNPSQLNYTNIPLLLSIFPETVSTKTVVHYAQSITKGSFERFDYGSPLANERRYGKGVTKPKAYNLSKISAPVVFMYAEKDDLGVPQDVKITADKLNPNTLKENILIDWKDFTHNDFAIAKGSRTLDSLH